MTITRTEIARIAAPAPSAQFITVTANRFAEDPDTADHTWFTVARHGVRAWADPVTFAEVGTAAEALAAATGAAAEAGWL